MVYLALAFFTGLGLFAVELGFAYSLQAFLKVTGILGANTVQLPAFLNDRTLIQVLIIVSVMGLFRGILQWCQLYFTGAILEDQKNFQRIRLSEWAFYSQSTSSSQTLNLFTEKISSVGVTLNFVLSLAILVPGMVLLWVYLFHLAFTPTLYASVFFVILGLCMQRLDKKISHAGDQVGIEYHFMMGKILNNVKNLLLMQIYGTQEKELVQVQALIRSHRDHHLTYLRLSNLKFSIPQILGIFLLCFLTLLSLKTGVIGSALLISYFYLFVRFVQSLAETVRSASSFRYYVPQFNYMYNWWLEHFDGNRPLEKVTTVSGTAAPFSNLVGWRCSNLSFRYPSAAAYIFKDFNLDIRPGGVTALIGESGVGKSTLIQLLLGSIKPIQGVVELYAEGNEVLKSETMFDRLRQSVGYVGAESFIIEGTIRESLVYGLHTVPTKTEIEEALLAAECQFVLQMGLDHKLTDQGQGLSAGQKQRLSLARAILRKPKVLILDEATANLDKDTEQRLIETFMKFKGSMTIVIATHRESMLKLADHVLKLTTSGPVDTLTETVNENRR
jgi:ABC-type multidrug transport system fused ATPase/permease subunit